MIILTSLNLVVLSMYWRYSLSLLRPVFHAVKPTQILFTTSKSFEAQSKVVVLEKGKAKLFQDGNPLVYGG